MDEQQRRQKIQELCTTFLPDTADPNGYTHWHQIGFDHIAKDYGQGSGTTCGFLPHWLLWRLGCNDASLVNRSSPEQGLRWRTGDNLLIFSKHAKSYIKVDAAISKLMAGVKPDISDPEKDKDMKQAIAAGNAGPKPGDFVIIRGGNWFNKETKQRDRDSGHIFVLLKVIKADGKDVEWKVAQTGVSNNQRLQGGQIMTLKGKLKEGDMIEGKDTTVKGPHLVFIANIFGEEPDFPRRVTSYTDIGRIDFEGGMPDPAFVALFAARRSEFATNEWQSMIAPWLGWYEEKNRGGFITMSPSYIVLERGHEATRFSRAGGGMGSYAFDTNGVWTRTGDRLEIHWHDEPRQSWMLAKTFVPKEMTTGKPIAGAGGTLTSVKKMPPEIPARWAGTHFIGG